MNMTVNQVANLTGISVRTLHYYDEIGLLAPSEITQSGYRLYDDKAIGKLQQILFFRELDFPLKEIKKIMDNPAFDQHKALKNHKALLLLKRSRLDDLIRLVDTTLKGESQMSFKEFDDTQIELAQQKYAKEVQEKWGNTSAYAQSQKKTSSYGKEEWGKITEEANEIYREFALKMSQSPDSEEIQQLVKKWQAYITSHFYDCTKEILQGLGIMYVEDERFTQNIDRFAPGLADFISRAIKEYCKDN